MVFRGVAQFGRALRSGRRGRGFKSRHLDQSLAMTGIVRHGFFCYQTLVPLNKFVCKLYNVWGLPMHPIPPYCGRADFFVPAGIELRYDKF